VDTKSQPDTITNRIDGITHIPVEFLRPDPPCPKSVKIELTGRCNYRCGFCALRMRDKQPTAKDDMPIELFKRITTEMREAGVEEIGIFYLGETLMNSRLAVEAIKHLKDIGVPYVFLTTNGSLCTPNVACALMEAGLDSLKFSINACNEEQFEQVMGVSRRWFRKSIDNVKSTWQVRETNGFKTKLYASSIKYDGDQFEEMQDVVDEILPFVDEHYWLPLYSMGSVAEQRERELGYRPTAGNQGRLGGLVKPLPCWSAFTEGHVRSDGTFSLCCFDADGRFTVGDLKENSFMEVWHSDKFQEIRAAHLKEDLTGTVCEKCVAY